MTVTIPFTVVLQSDAEPGTGLGTEAVNDLVPRDSNGHAYLPATHLKGLLREHLATIIHVREWDRALLDAVLGAEGVQQGAVRVSDARAKTDARTRTITRTAIGEYGVASEGSLRTVEAVSVGTKFSGEMRVESPKGSAVELAARLGLQLISAIGGGRNRGSGACRVEFANETESPGSLLRKLDSAMKSWRAPVVSKPKASTAQLGTKTVWFSLVFRADGPICCPETPVVGANHLRGGIAIPASAVQGAILTRLDAVDSALASACFASAHFRCWPLLPTSTDVNGREVPIAVRVSMTHRVSKLVDATTNHFIYKDEAIAPIKWEEAARGSPMKGSDGVLLRRSNGQVDLWKSSEMPRLVTAHGVHAGGRNLYSMDSLAPMLFSGMIAVPEGVAAALEKLFRDDPTVALGKSRSVRGGGRLELKRLDAASLAAWQPNPKAASLVFVVQSPLELPEGKLPTSAGEMLVKLVEESGLGKVTEAHASTQVLFGWSRAEQGSRVGETQRLRAVRVISPGSVFVLASPVADLQAVLIKGIGSGRERGCGAILPHPGVASGKFTRPVKLQTVKSKDDAGKWAVQLLKSCGGAGPSPSQISALAAKASQGTDLKIAAAFLDEQLKSRPSRFSDVWRASKEVLQSLLKQDKQLVCRALRAWQDLAIIHRETKEHE